MYSKQQHNEPVIGGAGHKLCQSILRRNRFSTLRSGVNIDIYATGVNQCAEKNSSINTDDECVND